MRVKLLQKDLDILFRAAFIKYGTWNGVARALSVKVKTLRRWRDGLFTIPQKVYNDILGQLLYLDKQLHPTLLKDYWYIKEAARKGGFNSQFSNKLKDSNFKTLRSISYVPNSDLLAELLGVMYGDGHLSEYQATVTTHSVTDLEHLKYVKRLFKNIFNLDGKIIFRKNRNAAVLIMSSRNLVLFLNNHGMPVGNKVKQGMIVPWWIESQARYSKSFIRGLFDTDGCIYLDQHKVKDKHYNYLGWTITSYSDTLRSGIQMLLSNLDFTSTCSNAQKSVYLRKQKDIARYFLEIGSSNSKHLKRYTVNMEAYQSGRNGAHSKCA